MGISDSMNFFHPSNLLGRLALALFWGVVTFVVILIIGTILVQVPYLAGVGDILKKFAVLIGVLAGVVTFFTGGRPVA